MNEFVKQGEYVIVNVPYMEAYIHDDLFEVPEDADKESAIASSYGEGYRLLGVFNVRIFKNEDQDRYSGKLRTFSYPNTIETYPSETEITTLSIDGESEPVKVRVFKYYKGDIMMDSRVKQSSKNCEKYLGAVTKAKIPSTIPYTTLVQLWKKNFAINSVPTGIPPVIIECMVGTMCRSKKDPLIPFRMEAGKDPKYDQTGYYPANMRQVTSFTNVMAALTFEDMGAMLASSINMCRKGTKQTESPFEEILRM